VTADGFAAWLKERMEDRGLGVAQLMADMRVRYETVQAWRTGRRVPDPVECERLAAVLGCPVEEVRGAAGWPEDLSEPALAQR
jgi:transcriptional regulator with XRE-family HTH domain